jgi:hypothetical protein
MVPEMIMTAKINLRVLRSVSKFSSKKETRYYLNGVKLEIEPRAVTYIATDEYTLFVRRDPKPDDEPDNDMTGEFIIPTSSFSSFKLKKSDLGHADIFGNMAEMQIKHEDIGIVFRPIDKVFPNWRAVFPRLPLSGIIGQFNGNYISRFTKASEELSMGHPTIHHNGVGVSIIRFGQEDTFGCIMPFRVEDRSSKSLPEWIYSDDPESVEKDAE